MKFKAALVQTELAFGQLADNLQKLERLIRDAAAQGADIVCLPESCNVGYLDSHIQQMAETMCEAEDGVTLTRMRALACELGIYLIVPLFLKQDGCCKNTAVFLSDTGEELGRYAKTHLTASEQKWLTAGSEYPVFDTKFGRIGIMICNDVGWPEVARLLTLQKAEIIFLPAAWAYFKDVPFWWSVAARARAMENGVVVGAVNHVGQAWEDGTPFCGESAFIDPSGVIKGSLSREEDSILLQEFSLEEIREASRLYGYMVPERKPHEYGLLCQE